LCRCRTGGSRARTASSPEQNESRAGALSGARSGRRGGNREGACQESATADGRQIVAILSGDVSRTTSRRSGSTTAMDARRRGVRASPSLYIVGAFEQPSTNCRLTSFGSLVEE
jgi:hypothetical protein